MKKITMFVFLASAFGLNAQVCFNIDTSWVAAPNANCIISSDFNADGKLDLATSNYDPSSQNSSVSVLLGTGTGTFLPSITYTTNGSANSICSADFNHDGKQDVAVSDGSNNAVIFLPGN